jgi:hypothetical protein
MSKAYAVPEVSSPAPVAAGEVVLVASGDLRPSANELCWPAQEAMEKMLNEAFAAEGIKVRRAHAYDPVGKHGFIQSQRQGLTIFESIHPDAPIVVAESVWQYSAHVLGGLLSHRGPILTVANWSGQWPGLVGMLNLNACLRKYGKPFTTLWSKDFKDEAFKKGLHAWIVNKSFTHDASHVHSFDPAKVGKAERELGVALAKELKAKKAVLAVFDEGCMGMANAIIEDNLLNATGIFKERLSQSALFAAMREIPDAEAQKVRDWLDAAGMKFHTGPNEVTDLTNAQILLQAKMYIAAMRFADAFGADLVGIQYQQGLKDTCPASDLAEGLLNNVERPPVFAADGRELYAGKPLPHFNEVDEGAGVDLLVTNRVWTAMGLDPASTLHDVRWGEAYKGPDANGKPIDGFVWLLQISGAVPASHLTGGYKGAVSERQPAMYFRLGGGTIKGVSKPGAVVWSRVFVDNGVLKADLGRATSVDLPAAEVKRRWAEVSQEWPVMHVILHGVSQEQFMARHASNHVNVVYAPTAEVADKALAAKAAMFREMGIEVSLFGVEI